ncbi:MAG: hypothetical protein AMJ69_10480 [Gammaproteobacteria bacterium SG8_47]|nr:MAG: hypothetical protein AMJ69_10480 [Gammaproteobacteria bacterium SG8_47]
MDDSERLPRRAVLARLAISESGFVFDPTTGHSFIVNETGLVVLRRLQAGSPMRDLIVTLQDDYDAAPAELERDVLEFVGSLRKLVDAQ